MFVSFAFTRFAENCCLLQDAYTILKAEYCNKLTFCYRREKRFTSNASIIIIIQSLQIYNIYLLSFIGYFTCSFRVSLFTATNQSLNGIISTPLATIRPDHYLVRLVVSAHLIRLLNHLSRGNGGRGIKTSQMFFVLIFAACAIMHPLKISINDFRQLLERSGPSPAALLRHVDNAAAFLLLLI